MDRDRLANVMEKSFEIALKHIFKMFNKSSSSKVYDLVLHNAYKKRPFYMLKYSTEFSILMEYFADRVNLKKPKIDLKNYTKKEIKEAEELLEVVIYWCNKIWGVKLQTKLLLVYKTEDNMRKVMLSFWDIGFKKQGSLQFGEMIKYFINM